MIKNLLAATSLIVLLQTTGTSIADSLLAVCLSKWMIVYDDQGMGTNLR
jgi:hypothetical protein